MNSCKDKNVTDAAKKLAMKNTTKKEKSTAGKTLNKHKQLKHK